MSDRSVVAAPLIKDSQTPARIVLARNGKSFHWASTLFDRKTAADAAILYAFCRAIDDIADHQPAIPARRKLAAIRKDVDAGRSRIPPVEAFIDLARRRQFDSRIPGLLMNAVLSDCGPVRMASWSDLARYAYGVASTVGLMMCDLMGVRNPAAYPFAVDLGIAMQLTNIARDVVEDARCDRRYLPDEWLGDDLPPSRLLTGAPWMRRQITRARKIALDRAFAYYRSADQGMRYIPFRARLAVVTASRVYEAIGDCLMSPWINWEERAFVGTSGKIRQTVRAFGSILLDPSFWPVGPRPVHDARLHRPLTGLPGINGTR